MITSLPRVAIAVRDMDRAVDAFRSRFGMPVHEFEWAPEELGGRMALCVPPRGSHIELLSPTDPDRPHSRVFLNFLERRGEGLYALILHAPDPDREAEALERRGLRCLPRMAEAGGRDIHPRDACGVLIRIYPEASHARIDRELGPHFSRSAPSGLSGIQRVLVAVRDLDAAVTVYRDRLGLEASPVEVTADARRVVCTPPGGARIELLAPVGNESSIGRFLGEHGEGMFALGLESDDVEATLRTLTANRVSVHQTGANSCEIEPAAAFGVRFRVEARAPGESAWK